MILLTPSSLALTAPRSAHLQASTLEAALSPKPPITTGKSEKNHEQILWYKLAVSYKCECWSATTTTTV